MIDLSELGVTELIEGLLSESLLGPVNEFQQRKGKNVRTKLVELGFRLSFEVEPEFIDEKISRNLHRASQIVECIHNGSLIVDDIQDGSLVRRDAPTLHHKLGVPLALNAGNWLYFWALSMIRKLDIPMEESQSLSEDLHTLMYRAHFGQALDIGVKIHQLPKQRVSEVSLTSMELKTGTLLAMALRLGSALASDNTRRRSLMHLGHKLGLLLQIFDDLGNFMQPPQIGPSKRFEDLRLGRPTWIWSVASLFNEDVFDQFKKSLLCLPDETLLSQWVAQHNFEVILIQETQKKIEAFKLDFCDFGETHPIASEKMNLLINLLENSYVKKT